MSVKTLYFLRHAKAVSAEGAADDHERQLTERGERDAVRMGEYMKRQNILPALTLCSTSLRTRQTLHLLETALGTPLNARMSGKLYLASPKEMLEEIAQQDSAASSLMVLAHNPSLQQLAMDLCVDGDEHLLDEMTRRFPTAALAEIAYPAEEWKDIRGRAGMLKRFVIASALVGV